jgi:hypothetical protein
MLPWLYVTQDLPASSVNLLIHTFFRELLLPEALGLILDEDSSSVSGAPANGPLTVVHFR